MGKETEGFGDPRESFSENRQERIIKDDFTFQQATIADVTRLTAFYNEVIEYNRLYVAKLDKYYRMLGMTAHGTKTYRSVYYDRIITANRYSYDLRTR